MMSKQDSDIYRNQRFTSDDYTNNLDRIIQNRWSPRAFRDDPLPRELLEIIFDAGRHVASSFNEQPWRIVLTTKGSSAYEQLFSTLIDFNQSWVQTAPHLGVVCAKKHFSGKNKRNRHYEYDCGAFMAVSSLKATSLNVRMHQMAGFKPEQVQEVMNIPEEYEPITLFVIGRVGDVEQLPEDLQDMEDPHSDRKNLDQVLYFDEWKEVRNEQNQ